MIILPQEYGRPLPARLPKSSQRSTDVVNQRIPEGDPGARFTLHAMKDLVWSYGCKQLHSSILVRITNGLTTDNARIDAVYNWVTSIMRYVPDPPDRELIKSPCRIFNEVKENGVATGDCDDMSVMLASSFQLLGMPVGFNAVSNELMAPKKHVPLDHVFCIVYDRDKKSWIGVDPVAPGKLWDGHKQMIDLIGNPPPFYWIIEGIKNFIKSIFMMRQQAEARPA